MSKFIKKKQIVLAVLVVALGAAVYLNYYFSLQSPGVEGTSSSDTSSKNLGDAQYVNNPSAVTPSDDTTSQEDPTGYFAQARLNRENARQEALDVVVELMNSAKISDETEQQALAKTVEIAQAIEQESKIESLIKAKGFADCVVFIEDDKCSVVVAVEEMTAAQALQITEAVTAQSNIVAQNINIVPVNS